MRIIIPKLSTALPNFLRQCGYTQISNPHKNQEVSYARSLNPGRFYPRFHAYLEIGSVETKINLHLDAKKPSYEGTTAHSGEYEGALVEKEAERIKNAAQKFLSQTPSQPLGFQKKKSFWKRLFS
ncbi:MAG: hypothetical protein HYY86_01075 [Candidatus Harrisonbacteria bacterium]|nr:hypothetical protein [Candidatus Harrisonbacteria bacterium]